MVLTFDHVKLSWNLITVYYASNRWRIANDVAEELNLDGGAGSSDTDNP